MTRTLITSALPYANGYIHLGHLAGAYLPADIYARFMRLSGEEVLYICGSDEHGVAITISAEKEGVTPKEIIDKYHNDNLNAFTTFGMSFDFYSRTSNKLHHKDSVDFFEELLRKGFLLEREEKQFFDTQANMFLPDRYVEGECPNCGAEGARGDQCDKCGAYYEQTELKNPKSTINGSTPVLKSTTHWYFKLGDFQESVEAYIDANASVWKDNVVQQAKSWLKMGLTDRAITRDLSWGVSIEGAKGIDADKAKGKVLYVWFDAVLGYITATKEWALSQQNENNSITADDWKKWWGDKNTEHIAFIGKDNIVFHAIMLPALEMAYGGYILPHNIPANEFLNLEGQKFSKSRNWSIDLRDFINDFGSPQAIDALRYTLAATLPENKDADFTWKDYQAKNNNELAAILGNFVNRILTFIHKNMGGCVPILDDKYAELPTTLEYIFDEFVKIPEKTSEEYANLLKQKYSNILNDNDVAYIVSVWMLSRKVANNYRKFRIKDAVAETMNIARAANKYFNDEQPWKTIKNDVRECNKTLYMCSQMLGTLSFAFAPILPYTAKLMKSMLDIEQVLGMPDYLSEETNWWNKMLLENVPQGQKLGAPIILFNQVEDSVIQAQVAKLGEKQENSKQTSINNTYITIDDFKKVELRVATIVEAESVPKSKKLIKLQVKIGEESRQILAGVAEHYTPSDLIGKSIVVVANLHPTKLMGQESNGMMLCAVEESGKLVFVTPESDIVDGSIVR